MSSTDRDASDSSSDASVLLLPSAASSFASSVSSLAPPSFKDADLQCPQLPAHYPPFPANETPRVTAAADVQTPDSWIKRNPDLIRLTGKHPFNSEAPVRRLYNAGFITPAHLHFVRNHGAVPRVGETQARSWRIRIHGLVERECSLSLHDLQARFDVVTLPVTLVCAGNRRKEQNVLRKSLGFSWGPSGLSTALWTGVYLADVLAAARPRAPAKHVVFEGADTDLPHGPYGTSQRLSWAADRGRGMLIAWAMNGLPLEPDHGFPVRMIVPGQIGGRSVKWLTTIEVSARESQHYLHFFDNKVLPTHLSPEQARSEEHWWYDSRYIITELNVNSAIAKPDHEEILDIDRAELEASCRTYTIRGYAYAGGGRRVSRVEISLDDGHSWRLGEVEYPEDMYRAASYRDAVYGSLDLTMRDTCFCWCIWAMDVAVPTLARAHSITVRAMDESMNVQPRDMYPNPTSMMNNWWFRVAIVQTATGIRFEHPAPVGKDTPGWMERMKAAGDDILRPNFSTENGTKPGQSDAPDPEPEVSMANPEVTRRITRTELETQDKQQPWFVVGGEVYDGTGYLNEHPGGDASILLVAGDDATDDFMAIHSVDAKIKLRKFHIGTLVDRIGQATPADPSCDDVAAPFLTPKVWKQAKLAEMERVNHDSFIYRFALSGPQQRLGLLAGQHVFVRLRRKDTREMVQRAYTPVSRQDAVGSIEFLIKLYLPCEDFPLGGKMTTGFHQLHIGDAVELKGPLGSFAWTGPGSALWKGVPRTVARVGLVCGGSGITPVLQVLRSILHDPADGTRVWLLDANKREADILCRDELHALHTRHGKDRFALHLALSRALEGWTHGRGRITDAMLAAHLPPPAPDTLILVCGPAGMVSDVVRPGLRRLGWDLERSLVVF